MQYVKIQTIDPIIDHATGAILSRLLAGECVAWFLSGGSAIELEVCIAQALQTYDVSRLYVGLIDERYGRPGHTDENYAQLMNAHFPLFIHRVLGGEAPEKTASLFGNEIKRTLQKADYSLGIFGIGSDGHTAGIKPGSPAVSSPDPAVFYEWDDYKRITMTPAAIRQLDEAIIYAVGIEKADTLRTLVQRSVPETEQPAQVLKDIKNVTLYTDAALQLNSAQQSDKQRVRT